MSRSMTLSDLVQQVYYTQEKVLLDFEPYDDKYREVIMECRLVLQELQKEEDWLWLRERCVLGDLGDRDPGRGGIPEFELPDWCYKPSALHDDGVRLYSVRRGRLVEGDYIVAPWANAGEVNHPRRMMYGLRGEVNVRDGSLLALWIGHTITFNRRLSPAERGRVAVTDVQREIWLPEVPPRWDEYEAKTDDERAELDRYYKEERRFSEIPEPNYVVFRIAALHCVGSPVTQMRQQDLTDTAQKLLSALREENAMATQPNHVEYVRPGYVNVV